MQLNDLTTDHPIRIIARDYLDEGALTQENLDLFLSAAYSVGANSVVNAAQMWIITTKPKLNWASYLLAAQKGRKDECS
jgi:hypothetical protein